MYKLLLCGKYLTTRYIALISIVSVMLGVATLIVVNGVMWGFHAKMRERLRGTLSDIVVDSRDLNGFRNPESVMEHIRTVAGDKVAAMTPAIEVFGMIAHQNQQRGQHHPRPVMIVGIDPKGRAAVGDFQEFLMNPANRQDPSFALRDDAREFRSRNPELIEASLNDVEGAIVGYQIATYRARGMKADQYLIQPGHEIILTTITAGKPEPVDVRLPVADVYKSEMSEYDSKYVFVPYRMLQQLRQMGNAATTIHITLHDYADAPEVVRTLSQALPPHLFSVQTWESKQGPLLMAVKVEAGILNIILFFIIAVAGFGILAVFFMIVVEKTKDIGILKAIGASDVGVMGIFVGYGLALGMLGCALGAAFGIAFTLNINPIEQAIYSWTGFELFPRDIYYFKEIPTLLDPWMVVLTIAGAMGIAVSASVLPALRAARLRPVEALRYE